MGCGVSKEDITKLSRIQTVIVNVGSPESHLKAHEAAALKQNHSLLCLVGTQCNGPSGGVNNSDHDSSLLHVSTLALSDGLQLCVESPQSKEVVQEEDIQKEEDQEGLPQQCETKTSWCDLACDETPQVQQVVQESPLFRSTNGLIGTLAGLDEILGIQEASSLKLAIKVTADKIMSYGGVLHSLEDQMGGISYPLECNTYTSIELEHQAKDSPKVLQLTLENCDMIDSTTFTRSPKPSLEGFCKRLPPILTPPNSSVVDNTSIPDPFAKTPFPIQCQPKIEEIQDLTDNPQPPSPQLPHTSAMVALEKIKDITVMSGTSFSCEESQHPLSITLLGGMHCDVDNTILLETMETRETANGDHGSNSMHQNLHNIIVSDLIQDVGKNIGENKISPMTPFSTPSHRIEYLEEGDIKPLSSEEFYS